MCIGQLACIFRLPQKIFEIVWNLRFYFILHNTPKLNTFRSYIHFDPIECVFFFPKSRFSLLFQLKLRQRIF